MHSDGLRGVDERHAIVNGRVHLGKDFNPALMKIRLKLDAIGYRPNFFEPSEHAILNPEQRNRELRGPLRERPFRFKMTYSCAFGIHFRLWLPFKAIPRRWGRWVASCGCNLPQLKIQGRRGPALHPGRLHGRSGKASSIAQATIVPRCHSSKRATTTWHEFCFAAELARTNASALGLAALPC